MAIETKKPDDTEPVRIARVPPAEEDDLVIDPESQTDPETLITSTAEEDANADKRRLLLQRQNTYRSHYPPTIPVSKRSKSEAPSGDSFTTLKSEMERMKAKLLELESTAKELDDEFRVTHRNLEGIGKARGKGSLATLDEVEEAISCTDPSMTTSLGTLTTKATRDMDDARRLLAQIERLTAAEPSGVI